MTPRFDVEFNLKFKRHDFLDREQIKLVGLGDFHIGSKDTNEQFIEDTIAYIAKSPDMYVVLNGDIIECVTKQSKGNIYSLKYTSPDDQFDRALELLTPIKDRILFINSGNHDGGNRSEGHDYNRQLALVFNLSDCYHPVAGYLEIRVGKKPKNKKPFVYSVYTTHGRGGGATHGSKANALNKFADVVASDIVLLSHMHGVHYLERLIATPDFQNKKVITRKQRCILCSAFMDYGGYGMRGGYHPSPVGLSIITFYGTGKGGIEVTHLG